MFIKKRYLAILFIFLGVLLSFSVNAEEITDFDVSIKINEDAVIEVVEKISYDFGNEEKHGMYRDVLYKYKARGGNFNLRISDISATDPDGNPYNFEVSNQGDYKRIKIGDADAFVSGVKNYVISYKVDRAINYFIDYDELYWNVTGHEWNVPIKQEKAKIILPQELNEKSIQTECFAGPDGSVDKCISSRYEYSSKDTVKSITFTNDKLNSGEGLTVVIGMPKEIIIKPPAFSLILEIIKDNWILVLPIFTFIILFYLWRTKGRDPAGRGTIVAQFDAPDNLSPAQVGAIIDERADKKDISAEIVGLAVLGYLKINRIPDKGILKSDDYELEKLKAGHDLKNEFQRQLLDALFKGGDTIVKLSSLKNKFYKDLNKIIKEIYIDTVNKGYFSKNPNKVRGVYITMGIVFLFAAWLLGSIFGLFGIISFILSGVIVIIFSFFMPAKTRKGVSAREHILGLKQYLQVAEKDRIEFHNAPEKNPRIFEKLLPFAMVLNVEKAWAGQFKDLYNQAPDWYSDPSGRAFSALALTDSLSGFSTKTNTALASSPSSASSGGSGFSGGGSGGGFGGGGGGSW
ncbi:hypothetical protein DRH27_04585 [Candidatus Falkowbacteria bacterium]|nr:MAG: hypothetical protein DRH27_04585 [Candidatus Falkowbacteria bacterium]